MKTIAVTKLIEHQIPAPVDAVLDNWLDRSMFKLATSRAMIITVRTDIIDDKINVKACGQAWRQRISFGGNFWWSRGRGWGRDGAGGGGGGIGMQKWRAAGEYIRTTNESNCSETENDISRSNSSKTGLLIAQRRSVDQRSIGFNEKFNERTHTHTGARECLAFEGQGQSLTIDVDCATMFESSLSISHKPN